MGVVCVRACVRARVRVCVCMCACLCASVSLCLCVSVSLCRWSSPCRRKGEVLVITKQIDGQWFECRKKVPPRHRHAHARATYMAGGVLAKQDILRLFYL